MDEFVWNIGNIGIKFMVRKNPFRILGVVQSFGNCRDNNVSDSFCFFICYKALLFPGGSVYNTTNTFSNISKCKSVDGKSSVVCPFQRADGGARQQGNPR